MRLRLGPICVYTSRFKDEPPAVEGTPGRAIARTFVCDRTEEDDPAKRDLWLRIRDGIAEVLDSTTLADLIAYKDEGRVDSYMFYI